MTHYVLTRPPGGPLFTLARGESYRRPYPWTCVAACPSFDAALAADRLLPVPPARETQIVAESALSQAEIDRYREHLDRCEAVAR